MMTVGVMVYLLLAMLGGWGSHSGLGACFVALVWLAGIGYSLLLAFLAPWWVVMLVSAGISSVFGKEVGRAAKNVLDALDFLCNGIGFILPTLGVAAIATAAYFLGAGDWLVGEYPDHFSAAGFLFTFSGFHLSTLLALAYILYETWAMLDRFGIVDEWVEHLPEARQAVCALSVEIARRSVDGYRRHSPTVREKASVARVWLKGQCGVLGRMCRELWRYGHLRYRILRAEDGGADDLKNEAMLCGAVIRGLWLECWIFVSALAVAMLVLLAAVC